MIKVIKSISYLFLILIIGCKNANLKQMPTDGAGNGSGNGGGSTTSYSVTINKNINEGVISDTSNNSLNCGLTCTSIIKSISKSFNITLQFTANTGYTITGWTGCDSVSNSNTTCSINNLQSNKNIVPNIIPILTRSCTITNGVGQETSSDNGSTWSSCSVVSCSSNYSISIDNTSCEQTFINNNSKLKLGNDIGCALNSSGVLYCTGVGSYGSLGNSSSANNYVMTQITMSGVLSGKTIIDFSPGGGGSSSCVIASDNQVYCWGRNAFGSLGDGTYNNSDQPIAVDTSGVLSGKTILKISAEGGTTCVIASDNQAYCWGYGEQGSLGDGTLTYAVNQPVAVDTSGVLAGKSLIDIQAGSGITCALSSEYKIYCWGYAGYGTLGNGYNYATHPQRVGSPVEVSMTGDLVGKKFRQLITGKTANNYTVCALTDDFKAYCWGAGWVSANDPWDPTAMILDMYSNVPIEINMTGVLVGQKIKSLSVASDSVCVLTDSNLIACYGNGTQGSLSGGTTTPSSLAPVEIVDLGDLGSKTVDYLIGGKSSHCAYSEGQYYCWGFTSSLGVGLSYSYIDYPTLILSAFPF